MAFRTYFFACWDTKIGDTLEMRYRFAENQYVY